MPVMTGRGSLSQSSRGNKNQATVIMMWYEGEYEVKLPFISLSLTFTWLLDRRLHSPWTFVKKYIFIFLSDSDLTDAAALPLHFLFFRFSISFHFSYILKLSAKCPSYVNGTQYFHHSLSLFIIFSTLCGISPLPFPPFLSSLKEG